MTKQEKVKEVIRRLGEVYSNPRTALYYSDPFQLLVAAMLSAQATDVVVNQVTPALFAQYRTPKDFAGAPLEELEKFIKRINYYRNKAKSIKKTAQMIIDKHQGTVPDTMEELDALPGVARKTANVVLGNAFGIVSGIVVDTHVARLSQKLKLTKHTDPVKIEQDLMQIVPKDKWIDFSHLLINHGRDICKARPHSCSNCPLSDLCPDRKN